MSISPFFFAKVPPIYFGTSKLQQLPKLLRGFNSNTVLLVTGGKSLAASGKLGEIKAMLDDAGITIYCVACQGEPTTQEVDRICNEYRGKGVEAVVGIGGGSVIDMGKAVSAMLPHSNSVFDHLEGVGKGIPHSGVKLPYIVVPTTSGTGGEVTKNAVISEVGPNGYKKSLRHDNLIPDAVIVDGTLLTSCPRSVTAACGMDAFTQLLEPYLSPTASPMTDAIAQSGLQQLIPNLLLACGEGAEDTAVREAMAYASLCSGIALTNAGLGIVHGLASPIGGYFPIPHGVVCGTLMAAAVRANWQALQAREPGNGAIAKMAWVGQLLTPEKGKSDEYYCTVLVETLEAWTEQLELPRLGHYGIQHSDLDKILADTQNRNNPIALTRDEIAALVEARL
ncbi:MAG TPA: iron-containing alcohol dehydrogenase [Leptolyngbyaceae cyanobacterium]